jgi:hypothetical protein
VTATISLLEMLLARFEFATTRIEDPPSILAKAAAG